MDGSDESFRMLRFLKDLSPQGALIETQYKFSTLTHQSIFQKISMPGNHGESPWNPHNAGKIKIIL
jgi:hypothetical protein